MAMLVVEVVVGMNVLIEVVFLQTLPSAGGNLVVFVVPAGRGRCGGTLLSGGTIAAAAATPAAPAPATPFVLVVLFTAGTSRALGKLPDGRCIHIKVLDPGQDFIKLQIGVQIQVQIEFRLANDVATRFFPARFFATRFVTTRCFTTNGGTVIPARSRRAFVPAAQIFSAGLVAARFFSAWRGFLASSFRLAGCFSSLRGARDAFVAPAAIPASASISPTIALFVPMPRSLLAPRFATRRFGFILVHIDVFCQIRLDHFSRRLEIIIQRQVHIILKASALRP